MSSLFVCVFHVISNSQILGDIVLSGNVLYRPRLEYRSGQPYQSLRIINNLAAVSNISRMGLCFGQIGKMCDRHRKGIGQLENSHLARKAVPHTENPQGARGGGKDGQKTWKLYQYLKTSKLLFCIFLLFVNNIFNIALLGWGWGWG